MKKPEDNYLPPPPTFLVYTYSLLISSIFLATELLLLNQDAGPPVLPLPTFLMFSLNTFVLALLALATLEENNRGKDVWQTLELNPIIFWYMTGELPETLEAVVEKLRKYI